MSARACPPAEELSAFVLGTLPERALEEIAAHLDGCRACDAAVQSLESLSDPMIAGLRRSPPANTPTSRAADSPVPEQLGDYRILREIGRGGMGIVYEAEQVSLGRRVALKVMPRQTLLDQESLERFRRESRAVARLHHTNIVQIFGTGEQDGLHYFVMQLIPGAGLDALILELRGRPGRAPTPQGSGPAGVASPAPLLSGQATAGRQADSPGILQTEHLPAAPVSPSSSTSAPRPAALAASLRSGRGWWGTVARIGMQVADALAHAHAQGILHRDIKPSNLLLDAQGNVWVTDFGLAKLTAGEDTLTQPGDIIGTLRYMAPERFRGDSEPRSDVYSVGVTLYELLTLRPPFPGSDRNKLLHQMLREEPRRPRQVNPEVPRDLETIVLKAIAREPAHRYTTAAELADDLRRFLEDRPIRARRASVPERLWRWCRRDPRTAGLVGALLLVFVAGFVGVATQWLRAESKAGAEKVAREQAERAMEDAKGSMYLGAIAQARLEWRLNNMTGAEQLLDGCERERRGWEWGYLHGVNHSELLTCRNQALVDIGTVAFSPDGRLLAFGGFNPYREVAPVTSPVELWDVTTGQRLRTLDGTPWVQRLAFSPDGRLLAVSQPEGPVQLWETATGKLVRTWEVKGTAVFSPDGRLLAAGTKDAVAFQDAATGAVVPPLPSKGGRVTFSPDGKHLAVSGPEAVAVRDATTGQEVCRLPHGPGKVGETLDPFFWGDGPELAFSPDGGRLVTATSPPRIWDVRTGQLLHTLGGHTGVVPGVAFSPDGRLVASAGADSTVRVWDASTGGAVAVLRGHTAWAGCVAFHPDGWCLASGGRQPGDVKLWDLTRQPEHLSLPDASAQDLAFTADGRVRLVNVLGRIQDRDPASGETRVGEHIDLTEEYITPGRVAAFSGDGRRLAAIGTGRRTVKLWDAESGKELARLGGLEVRAVQVAVSRDGGRVAAAGEYAQTVPPRQVRVWDTATEQLLGKFEPALGGTRAHGAVALSPDGGRVAYDDYPGGEAAGATVRVHDVASGRELLTLRAGDALIYSLTFSTDGVLLAAGDWNGKCFVWDLTTGRRLYAADLEGPSRQLVFSPNGGRLAGVDRDQVKVWDVRTGKEVLTLRGTPPRPSDGGFNPALAWSPDGRLLAAANWDASTCVWDGTAREEAAEGPLRQVPGARIYAWHLEQAGAALSVGLPKVAAFHFERVRDVDPPDDESAWRRGHLFVQAGAWDRAGADLGRAFAAHDPDEQTEWQDYARTLVLRGDHERYHRLCLRMVDRYAPGSLLYPPVVAARVCSLAPGGLGDAAEVVRWGRRA